MGALSALRSSWRLTMHYRLLIEQGSMGVVLTRLRNLVAGTLHPETEDILDNLEAINQSTADTKEAKARYSETI